MGRGERRGWTKREPKEQKLLLQKEVVEFSQEKKGRQQQEGGKMVQISNKFAFSMFTNRVTKR